MFLTRLIHKIKTKGIRHIVLETIPWLFFRTFDPIVFKVIKKIYLRKPLKNVIIIESHNDFDSSGGAFYDYLLDKEYNKKYKIVWFLRNRCPKNLPPNVEGYRYNRFSIKRMYYYCVSKYIVCGHFMIPSIRQDQISYYASHGAFSLKAIKGKIVIPKTMSFVLTPSENLKPLMADQLSMEYPSNRQIVIGYPYIDVLYNSTDGDLHKLTTKKFKKMILWMPTLRKSVDGRNDFNRDDCLGIPIIESIEDYHRLNDILKEQNALVIIKIHPMQDLSNIKIKTLSNIIVLNAYTMKKFNIDNYYLMKDADALISDYSSVAFDYLHLDRPLAYMFADAKDYKLGINVKHPEMYIAGNMINSYQELLKFIIDVLQEKDTFKNQRSVVFHRVWDNRDGKNCERLVTHMNL